MNQESFIVDNAVASSSFRGTASCRGIFFVERDDDFSPPASSPVNEEDVDDSDNEYAGAASRFQNTSGKTLSCSLGSCYVDGEDTDLISFDEQLKLAHDRIQELESRLDVRERELRLAQSRARKLAHQGRRLRRLARSGDLFRSSQSTDCDLDKTIQHVDDREHIVLTITGICPDQAEDEQQFPVNNFGDAQHQGIPLYLRKLEGQLFAVGKDGATIGSGDKCGIWIPPEGHVYSHHAIICHENGRFHLKPGRSEGSRLLYCSKDENFSGNNQFQIKKPIPVSIGSEFVTGIVKWTVTPMPKHKLIIGNLFKAVRAKDIANLKAEWKKAQEWNREISILFPKGTNSSLFIIDYNTEEDLCYKFVDEKAKTSSTTGPKNSRRDSSLITVEDDKQETFPLLHVAVDFLFFEGIQLVLQGGCMVNKQSTGSKLTPLHIAVRHSDIKIVSELLKHGADLELTDVEHYLPITLAESYLVRRVLLSSMMLCCAADGGDLQEVKRLLDLGISPNVKALSHKSPLHLASLNGHVNVVQYLLDCGASVNNLGGRRQRTPLHYASLGDHVEVGKLLLAKGADEEIVDSLGYTALNLSNGGEMCRLLHKGALSLCLATQAGDVEEVRKILETNANSRKSSSATSHARKRVSLEEFGRRISRQMALSNLGLCLAVDQRNEQGHAPLHLAATAGNMELVQLLVSYGATIDLPGGLDKWSPLFYASLAGHVDIVGFLVSMGADVDRHDAQGFTVLEHVEKNIEEFKDKLESNRGNRNSLEINSFLGNDQQLLAPPHFMRQPSDSALPGKSERSWMKRQHGRLQHVLCILQSGQQKLMDVLESRNLNRLVEVLALEDVDINAPLSKSSMTTALHYCAMVGLPEFSRVLLQSNADPYSGDSNSFTAMHCAARYGHEDVIQVFANAKLDVNFRTQSQGFTPLHVAAINSREEAIRTLLAAGADPKIKDRDGLLPFDLATELPIQSLLARDECQLYVVAAKGDVSMMKSLIDRFNIDTRFRYGLTPLLVACEWGQYEVAELLLQNGADINKVGGRDGSSPLHIAARKSLTDIVGLLIRHGAQLGISDHDNKTPFEVATTNSVRKILVNARSVFLKAANNNSGEQDGDGDITSAEGNKCRICFDNPINTIILPCGHQAFCKNCACQLEICAFDRRPISQVVPVFYAGVSTEES